ncbi:MAG TPA: hypothetical protein ACFYD3_00985 [Candidatus Hypogeohydataceae bacterium YC41]
MDEKGKRTAVKLSIKKYDELLEGLNDLKTVLHNKGEERYPLGKG